MFVTRSSSMGGFMHTLLFGLTFFTVTESEMVVNIPGADVLYQIQRSSILPMTLECPSSDYKYIEVHGVTLANQTDVIIAGSLYLGINAQVNEECLANQLVNTGNGKPSCIVTMHDVPFDEDTKLMEKVVMFDCRKTLGGDSSGRIKTVTKKAGTINIKCPEKDDMVEIVSITLASGQYVDVVEAAWKCTEENLNAIGNGNGGHCQIPRQGYLNQSEMTVKYKCSSPPKRDHRELLQTNEN